MAIFDWRNALGSKGSSTSLQQVQLAAQQAAMQILPIPQGLHNTAASQPLWITTSGGTTVAIPFPSPTGKYIACMYQDPTNGPIVVYIDQAYYGILQQIQSAQSPQSGWASPAPNLPFLEDGEFSLDEINQAEALIEDLQGAEREAETV